MDIVQEMDFCYLSKSKSAFPSVKISNSKDAYNLIRRFYSDDIDIYESFFILLLDSAQKSIGYAKISQGGVSSTIVDVRIICKYVVDSLASGVILAHNHPSGNLQASEADKKITAKIKECLRYFECRVLDHLIITSEDHFSFADEGIL
jgi:DNA repair protein RadC